MVVLGRQQIKDGKFLEVFGNGKPKDWNQRVFLPVVHVKLGAEMNNSAYRGAKTAYEAGADGVLLIDMNSNCNYNKLTAAAVFAREKLAAEGIDFLIGVNYLDLTYQPDMAVFVASRAKIPLLWSDNQGGKEDYLSAMQSPDWCGLYLGAVAFKYQAAVYDVARLSQAAKKSIWMDVSVTSGAATGKEIDLAKAIIFSEAIPDQPRGVASGVNVFNIKTLLPLFNVFIVASSISDDNDTLDMFKAMDLVDCIHGWKIPID